MTLPSSSTISSYGGPISDAFPVTDPTTELGSASLNPLLSDVAAMSRVSPRCIFQFTGSATAPNIATSSTWATGHDAVWGNANAVKPTLSRTALGTVRVQLPATITDALGNSVAVNIRGGRASCCNGSSPVVCAVLVTSSSTVEVTLWGVDGSKHDFAAFLFFVELF